MDLPSILLLVASSAALGALGVLQWQDRRGGARFRRKWEKVMEKQQRPFGEVSHEEDSFNHQP